MDVINIIFRLSHRPRALNVSFALGLGSTQWGRVRGAISYYKRAWIHSLPILVLDEVGLAVAVAGGVPILSALCTRGSFLGEPGPNVSDGFFKAERREWSSISVINESFIFWAQTRRAILTPLPRLTGVRTDFYTARAQRMIEIAPLIKMGVYFLSRGKHFLNGNIFLKKHCY